MASIRECIERLKGCLDHIDPGDVDNLVEALWSAYVTDNQIFLIGNGGSAATASHWANDWGKGIRTEGRRPLRVSSLTDNIAWITAIANDISFEDIFVAQLANFLNPGDVVVGISASGNSPNVIRALEYAKENNATTIGLLGFRGGKMKDLVDHHLWIRSNDYGEVETLHLYLGHLIANALQSKILSQTDATLMRYGSR